MSVHFLWLLPAGVVVALLIEVTRSHLRDLAAYLRELRLLREQAIRRRMLHGPQVEMS